MRREIQAVPAGLLRCGMPSAQRILVDFGCDRAGVTAVIFGIIFAILFLVAAIVIDYTRAVHEKSREQAALDAAALAASQYLGFEDEDVKGEEIGRKFFFANAGEGSTADFTIDLDGNSGTVTAAVTNDFGTTLLRGVTQDEVRRDSLRIGANTRVVKGSGTIEVGMALDNSGSMYGSKLDTLKQAAKDLLGIVFAGAEGTSDVKVSVVPFAASVNVGSIYAGSGWIYEGPESALPNPLFTGNYSRFEILGQMGQSWGGCVEARLAPHDVDDVAPDASDLTTMFLPMFAPDEPDDANAENAGYDSSGSSSDGYNNNYITDFGGTCPAPEQTCASYKYVKGVKTCKSYKPVPIPVVEAQTRSCKYQDASPSSFEGSATGPGYLCSTQALLPLTEMKQDVEDAIENMIASGNTNISEGTMWAWRTISPGAPFMEGRPYDDPENRKVLIVMTDGDNVHSAKSQHNKSVYAAYGYGVEGRLGTTYTSSSYNAVLNQKTLQACSNAKAANITVYTVAFGTDISSTGLALLKQCATSADHAFLASDGTALIQAFQQIGREISRLRVDS